ncbi:TSUP family transporter [Streptomyces sp. NPDC042319]|uniref:TSUP family transporter n=1 Tax=Streptomyces sp. NPDC042319 TaxID=3154332 RepID=UPI0033C60E1E
MSLYLLAPGLGMPGFLGTAAWFFFLVNAFKLPFSAGLGLLTPDVLLLDAVLLPAVLLGAHLGRRCIHRIDLPLFTRLTLLLTTLAGLNLLR